LASPKRKQQRHLVAFINPAIKDTLSVMPDLIRHPVSAWIPAFAGMTTLVVFNCRVNNLKRGITWKSPNAVSAFLCAVSIILCIFPQISYI
jgi:hypothetical protein